MTTTTYHRTPVRLVDGTEDGFDFDARYTESTYGGVAWAVLGWAQTAVPSTFIAVDDDGEEYEETDWSEIEMEDDLTQVVAVMVGDDSPRLFDRTDLNPIADDDFCGGCGQVGCKADAR